MGRGEEGDGRGSEGPSAIPRVALSYLMDSSRTQGKTEGVAQKCERIFPLTAHVWTMPGACVVADLSFKKSLSSLSFFLFFGVADVESFDREVSSPMIPGGNTLWRSGTV